MTVFNKKQIIKQVNNGKIDENITNNFLGEYDVADVFGTRYRNVTAEGFINSLKDLGIYGIRTNGGGYSFEGMVNATPKTPVIEDVIVDVVEEVKVAEVAVVEAEVVAQEKKEVDWEMINSLENKKYDKIKLDKYAEENFGIKLNQRNTLENMIKDFKSQL